MNYLAEHSIEYQPESTEPSSTRVEYEPMRRLLIVKNTSIKSEEELKAYAYLLVQYLVKLD